MVDLGYKGAIGRCCLALGLLLSSAGCGDFMESDSGATESQVRLIDRCERNGCRTAGAVEMTTGITADSVGFVLGPGESSLVIELDVASDSWTRREVLLRGEGVYFDGVRTDTTRTVAGQQAPRDFQWRSFSASSDRTIGIFTADSSSRIEVADARYDEYQSITCSVVAPGTGSMPSSGALVLLFVAVPLGARRLVRGRLRLKPAAG